MEYNSTNTSIIAQGTAKELTAKGIKLNGKAVCPVMLSVLAGFGLVEVVGQVERKEKQRGKAASIYRIKAQAGGQFTQEV